MEDTANVWSEKFQVLKGNQESFSKLLSNLIGHTKRRDMIISVQDHRPGRLQSMRGRWTRDLERSSVWPACHVKGFHSFISLTVNIYIVLSARDTGINKRDIIPAISELKLH